MADTYKYRVQYDVITSREESDDLVEEYGDPDELEDDPVGAIGEAIQNLLEAETVDYIDITSTVKVTPIT